MFNQKSMFAVIELAGHQYKVEKGSKFEVESLGLEEGQEHLCDSVLLISTDGQTATIGKPFVAGATVTLKVLGNDRGEKIRVFKMKAKKRERKTFGHRSYLSQVEVIDIKA